MVTIRAVDFCHPTSPSQLVNALMKPKKIRSIAPVPCVNGVRAQRQTEGASFNGGPADIRSFEINRAKRQHRALL